MYILKKDKFGGFHTFHVDVPIKGKNPIVLSDCQSHTSKKRPEHDPAPHSHRWALPNGGVSIVIAYDIALTMKLYLQACPYVKLLPPTILRRR